MMCGGGMPIYEFYWEEDSFLMEINADYEDVKKLLEEYKKSDEFYNSVGWAEFLEKRGIEAKVIEPEYHIYF